MGQSVVCVGRYRFLLNRTPLPVDPHDGWLVGWLQLVGCEVDGMSSPYDHNFMMKTCGKARERRKCEPGRKQ